ncbi:MAG: hypothetical protein AB7I30_21020, partial [Isosphaeraceae bacterium]
GDRQNSYAWSMQWYQGKLYVGTNRNFQCVEFATLAFYFPALIPLQAIFADPDVPCAPDPADLDLRAEVWRFTPETAHWERVYQSPVVPNPIAPGKSVALDIGYRDMVTFTEPNGVQALYLVGASAREYTPGLPPPRILRTTDGVNFAPIPQDPGTALGELPAITFRSTAVYNGKFYVTASPGLTGDGFLLESDTPWLGNNTFRLVTPPALKIYELAVFNGFLYIGAGDATTGYAVYKTNATGDVPYQLTSIVTGGAGRGPVQTSVVSMFPYRGALFVGSAGWYTTLLPSSELIRVNANDSWDLISGNPRQTPRGYLFPLSGLSDGFGNPFNAHIWRIQEHNGWLYAGTNDDSWGFRRTPLDPYLRAQYGFDLFASQDGVLWIPLSRNGLGNPYAFGGRTFASTPYGLFLGTVNYVLGADVYLGTIPAPRESKGAATTTVSPGILQPENPDATPREASRLDIEPLHGDEEAVLSWNAPSDAARFRVFRSSGRASDVAGMLKRMDARLAPPRPAAGGTRGRADRSLLSVPGGFAEIASTRSPVFHDKGLEFGKAYSYYIVAEDEQGQTLFTSSLAGLPSQAPPVDHGNVEHRIGELGRRAQLDLAPLASRIGRSRELARQGNLRAARAQLDEVLARIDDEDADGLDEAAREDIRRVVSQLSRRLELAESGTIPGDDLTR